MKKILMLVGDFVEDYNYYLGSGLLHGLQYYLIANIARSRKANGFIP